MRVVGSFAEKKLDSVANTHCKNYWQHNFAKVSRRRNPY